MKRLVALLMALCLAITPVAVLAEEGTSDVLDSSDKLQQVETFGIPTEAIVNEMKASADALYAEEKYEEAADVYYETAQKANFLANIMSQCAKPYYKSRSDSKSIPNIIYDELFDLENKSNSLKNMRNACYVYQGLCYSKMGYTETALAILLNALDIIETSQEEIWTLASEEIMIIIQYKTIEELEANREEAKAEEEKAREIAEAMKYNGKTYKEFKEHFGKANDFSLAESGTIKYYYDGYYVKVQKETDKILSISVS